MEEGELKHALTAGMLPVGGCEASVCVQSALPATNAGTPFTVVGQFENLDA